MPVDTSLSAPQALSQQWTWAPLLTIWIHAVCKYSGRLPDPSKRQCGRLLDPGSKICINPLLSGTQLLTAGHS